MADADTLPADATARVDGELPVVDPSCYELGEEIARGGFGRLLRARDRRLDREVAIKQLHASNAQLEARFRLEARITARLQHPAIVPVHEVGRWPSGEPFYAMKLVSGRSLREVLDATPALADRLALLPSLTTIADAVGYAHTEGVLHRDLKPGNIMLDERGGAFVVDWGLAKDRRHDDAELPAQQPESAALTASGAVLGTPPYLSPEQARGAPVDERADVYSLGALLYELVTGSAPYHGTSDEVLAAVTTTAPPPLLARQPAAPGELAAIIDRAMAREPGERYPSACELADDLRRLARGELVTAYRYSRLQRVTRWTRRHRAALVVGGAVAIALAATGVALRRHAERPWLPVVQPLDAVEEESSTVALSPDGRQLAFDSTRDSGDLAIWVGPLGGPPHRVSPPAPFAAHVRFRGNDRVLYTMPSGIVEQSLAGGPPRLVLPGSADHADDCAGRIVAWHRQNDAPYGGSELEIVDDTGVHPRLAIDPRFDVYALRCDRSGKHIVYTTGEGALLSPKAQIWLLDLDGGEPRLVAEGEKRGPAFHPDGKSIVFSAARGGAINLWEIPLAGGEPEQLTFGAGPDVAPEIASDGSIIVFNVENTAVPIVEYSLDHAPRRLTAAIDRVRSIAVSDDGQLLAYQVERRETSEIVLRATASGDERVLGTGMTPAFGPHSHTVYWVSGDRIVAAPGDGGAQRTLARVPGHAHSVAIGPDGIVHTTVFPDRGASGEAWSVAPDGTARKEAPSPYELVVPAPTGGWIAAQRADTVEVVPPGHVVGDPANRRVTRVDSWDRDGTSFIWGDGQSVLRYHVATGETERLLAVERGVQWLAGSPDGRTFYTAQVIGHVTRHVITNYGARPRPR